MENGAHPMINCKSTADLLRELLPKLNVRFETERDENRLNFSFSYQGANFLVHTWDGWQFIEVNYLPFFDAPTMKSDLVHDCCNTLNRQIPFCKYMCFDDDESHVVRVFVNVFAVLVNQIPDITSYLGMLLENCFRGAKEFEQEYNRLEAAVISEN